MGFQRDLSLWWEYEGRALIVRSTKNALISAKHETERHTPMGHTAGSFPTWCVNTKSELRLVFLEVDYHLVGEADAVRRHIDIVAAHPLG